MTRSIHTFVRVAFAAVVFAATASLTAQQSEERSDAGGRTAVGDAPGRNRDGFRPGQMEPRRDQDLPVFRPLTQEEHDQALEFARTNMPNFTEVWEQLPQERRKRMPPRMQYGFRTLLDAQKQEDQRLYDVLVRQMKLRDELIALFREPRNNRSPEVVRAKTREAVSLWIEQRELRIEQMEKALQKERQRLAEDKAQPDRLIDQQRRRLFQETVRFLADSNKFAKQAATQPTDETLEGEPATMSSPASRE